MSRVPAGLGAGWPAEPTRRTRPAGEGSGLAVQARAQPSLPELDVVAERPAARPPGRRMGPGAADRDDGVPAARVSGGAPVADGSTGVASRPCWRAGCSRGIRHGTISTSSVFTREEATLSGVVERCPRARWSRRRCRELRHHRGAGRTPPPRFHDDQVGEAEEQRRDRDHWPGRHSDELGPPTAAGDGGGGAVAMPCGARQAVEDISCHSRTDRGGRGLSPGMAGLVQPAQQPAPVGVGGTRASAGCRGSGRTACAPRFARPPT